MRRQNPSLLVAVMFLTVALAVLSLFLFCPCPQTYADNPCPDGRSCPELWRCCEHGCCAPSTLTPLPTRRDNEAKGHTYLQEWYWSWPFLALMGILAGICICGAWCLCCRRGTRSRQCSCILACCYRRPTSNHDSAGSCFPPPHYTSRCSSFHQAPPPYSEVTSLPYLYPLVTTYGKIGSNSDNKNAGSFVTYHYYRNYAMPEHGSLSATSTADSLNSSFMCNAANEANSIIPPPYSSASNYTSWRDCSEGGRGGGAGMLLRSLSSMSVPRAFSPSPPLIPRVPRAPHRALALDLTPDVAFRGGLITSPAQPGDSQYNLELDLIDYEIESGCKPQVGTSPPLHSPNQKLIFEHDLKKLHFTHSDSGSPPQPTSPTQFSRESTLGRSNEERRPRRLLVSQESVKKYPKSRKTSLYMPLSSVYPPARSSRMSPGPRMSSRSAPATPCGSLVPNLMAFSQRVSSSRQGSKASRLEEENDPLLSDDNGGAPDHKF